MRCGKCLLGHSRRPEIVFQRSAEAFRADRALDVRSPPESETFPNLGRQLPVCGLSKRTEFVNSCLKSRSLLGSPKKMCQKKVVFFDNKATGRLMFRGCRE